MCVCFKRAAVITECSHELPCVLCAPRSPPPHAAFLLVPPDHKKPHPPRMRDTPSGPEDELQHLLPLCPQSDLKSPSPGAMVSVPAETAKQSARGTKLGFHIVKGAV